ncbi:beta-barrel assembly-enhancing protease [Abditibacteriota bacterium]|nr:beta-barrel assembly-enhancing protease [Abditibacteriota bacterium]
MPLITRRLAPVIIGVGVLASAYLIWNWKVANRPGLRHLNAGLDYFAAQQLPAAEQEWKLGIQEDPQFWQCYQQLGDLKMLNKQYLDAEQLYRKASTLSPQEGMLFLKLAGAEQAQGHDEDAYRDTKKAAQLSPNDVDVIGSYGMMEISRSNYSAGLPALKSAHTLKPDDARYLKALAKAAIELGNGATVQPQLIDYLTRHPTDGEIALLLAVIYSRKPRTSENVQLALKYANQALPTMAGDERVYTVRGQILLDTNKVREATLIYQTGTQHLPKSQAVWRGLVESYGRLGDRPRQTAAATQLDVLTKRQQLLEHWRTKQTLAPNDLDVGLRLAQLEAEAGNLNRCQLLLDRLTVQFPDNPRVAAESARLHSKY